MRLLRRLWFLLNRRQQAEDLAAEIEFHRQMKADELRARGESDADVPAGVQRALGNDLLARERARDVWIAPWFQDVTQDARLALRMLTHDRRFALTAIVTLGLGMAVANTAFHFVNAAMFRDLPFEEPERLITIRTPDPRGFLAGVSYLEYQQWRAHTTAFEALSADLNQSVNIGDDALGAERLSGSFITPGTFRMLRVAPVLGREFVADDDRDGAPGVIILGYDIWRSRYGADANVLGRVIRVTGQPAMVIGVMPEGFRYPMVADVWLPMAMAPGIRNTTWASRSFGVVGRLKDGITVEQARSEIVAIGAVTVRERREVPADRQLLVVGVKDSQLANGARQLLWAFLSAAVVVLLLSAANVTNLLLARAWKRSREIAVRAALGGSRWRIVRQSLVECLMLGAGGALLGGVLSFAGFRAMSSAFNIYEAGAYDRPRKPFWFDDTLDASGWLFMAAVFALGSLAASLVPLIQVSRANANEVLAGGREGQAGLTARRWTSVLMTAQIAIAAMLLSAAGLFARNFIELYRTDPVMAIDGLVSMRLMLPARYASREQRLQFIHQLDDRLLAAPEFSNSTIGDVPLQTVALLSRSVLIEGEDVDPLKPPRTAVYVAAGPRFFDLVRIPARHGRVLSEIDALAGHEAAVVNQRFADQFLGGNAIGKRIQLSQPGPAPVPPPAFLTIVGVVPTIPDFNPGRADDPMVIAPLLGDPTPSRALSVIVRSDSKRDAAMALRREVAALDGDLPVFSIQTMEEQLAMTRMGARMIGSWFQALAFVAVALVSVGLYALVVHSVAQRRREIGVRIALGAHAAQIVWMFMRQTIMLLAVGLSLGIAAALAAGQLLTSFLGGVSSRDPATLAAVVALLSVIVMLSGLAPARRAVGIDPATVLRAD